MQAVYTMHTLATRHKIENSIEWKQFMENLFHIWIVKQSCIHVYSTHDNFNLCNEQVVRSANTHSHSLVRIYFDSSGCVYHCVHNWCCVCCDTTRLWKAHDLLYPIFSFSQSQCASAYLYIIHPRKIQLVMNNMTVLCVVCVCVFKDGIFSGFFMNALKVPAKLFTRTRTRSFCLVAMMVNGENGRLCVAVYGSLWLRLSCLLHYQVIGKIIL